MTTPAPGTEEEVETEETETPDAEVFTAADRAALKKALNAERKQHRDVAAKLTALEAQSMNDTDKAWQDKVLQLTNESEGKLKMIAARHALSTAGLQGKPDRLVKLFDLADVTVDDDGTLSGLDDQIKQMQAEYPGLFKSAGNPPPPGHLDIGGKNPPPVGGPSSRGPSGKKLRRH